MATPNIALVKYWGRKSVPGLNLPYNSSVSITLHEDALNTKTSVAFDPSLKNDLVYIDGKAQNTRSGDEKVQSMMNIIGEMRALAGMRDRAIIVSRNTFPSGSGLASSAAGAAALITALNSALSLNLNNRDLSILARRISGSACRSMFGGFVKWRKGARKDGRDSYAEQIAPPDHWRLLDIIGISSVSRKKVSSSTGHIITPRTSVLYNSRPRFSEGNAEGVIKAILEKDFERLAEITMRDSNNMHATMLDGWPPIRYMDDRGWSVAEAVMDANERFGKNIIAYTFDAGPNPHLITMPKYKKEAEDILRDVLGDRSRIIVSRIGDGPRRVGNEYRLIDGSSHPIL